MCAKAEAIVVVLYVTHKEGLLFRERISWKTMSTKVLFIKGIWILSLLVILTGFTLLSWGVSREYFEYRTATHIAIRDYPEDGIEMPAIVVCFRFRPEFLNIQTRIGEFFRGKEDYFNDRNDTWRVYKVYASIDPDQVKEYIQKKYLMRNRYCLFFKLLNHFSMDVISSSHYDSLNNFYTVKITTTPILSTNIWGYTQKQCSPKFVYISFLTDESAIPKSKNREVLKECCTRGFEDYDIYLTYSSLVNIKLPPPYDTNCRDYRKEGSSSHICYDKCLKEKTKKWNIVPGLVDREKYNKSEEYIGYGYVLEYEKELNKLAKSKTVPKDLLEKYRTVHYEWKGIKKNCRQSCSRPDCWSEDITPQITHFVRNSYKKQNETLMYLFLTQFLSYQPTLEVSTVPKQRLIDYIVYMSSMSSFWLGFCPLALVQFVVRKLGEYKKYSKVGAAN